MAKAPAFQFYSADWFIDTAQMSRAAKGLHIDLLAIQWSNGFINADKNGIPVGLNSEDLLLWEVIKHKYQFSEGKLINLKLEERRAARELFLHRQTENGAKGGRPKKRKNPTKTQLKPKLKPDESQKNPLEEEDEEEIELGEEEMGDGTEEGEENPYLLPAMMQTWKEHKPKYPEDRDKDLPALMNLSQFICKQANAPYNPRDAECMDLVLTLWDKWAVFVSKHNFFNTYSLAQVNTHSQSIFQAMTDGSAKRQTNQQNQQLTGTVISGAKDYGKL